MTGNADEWLFVANDPEGRTVGLTKSKFEKKIAVFHPGFTPERIKETIEAPDVITDNEDHDSVNYWVFVHERRYLRMVAAKPRGVNCDPGYAVSTAYFPGTGSRPTGRVRWQKPTKP